MYMFFFIHFLFIISNFVLKKAENITNVKRYHIFKFILLLAIWVNCIIVWAYVQYVEKKKTKPVNI